jgi:hypothetical protein
MRCRVSPGQRPLSAGHAASIAGRSRELAGFLGALTTAVANVGSPRSAALGMK